MAIYRQIQVSFWQDQFVISLTPEEKYFYLYLLTNSKTAQCGVYELPKRVIEFDTGYHRETVDKLLNRFKEYGKILYNDETQEIMLLNWIKHNSIKSPKVRVYLKKESENIKCPEFRELLYRKCYQIGHPITDENYEEEQENGYPIDTLSENEDTLSIGVGNKNKNKNNKKNNKKDNMSDSNESDPIPYQEIIEYLNTNAGKKFRHQTEATRKHIRGRYNDGFVLEDFKKVIDNKCTEWKGTNMEQYLRPETLFSPSKFESYLNQSTPQKGGGNYGRGSGLHEHKGNTQGQRNFGTAQRVGAIDKTTKPREAIDIDGTDLL